MCSIRSFLSSNSVLTKQQGVPLADKFYALIKYDHKADPGLITLNIFALSLYWIVVSRTRRIVRKFGPALSGTAIDPFRDYWDANKETSLRPIVVDVYPLILAHFYKPFYDYYLINSHIRVFESPFASIRA